MSSEDAALEAEPVEGVDRPEPEAEAEPEPALPEESSSPQPFREVRFVDVAMVLPSPNPVLVLDELDPPRRRLSIPIGMAEGVAIAHAARRTPTPRALTHELFVEVLEAFGVELETVRITSVAGASYAAELLCSSPSGRRNFVCRPSDAVALALRQRLPVPITVAEEVLDLVGFDASSGA